MEEQLILVTEADEQIGTLGKMEVHENGILHRAFSVFIFNSRKQLLLQKRASSKYHSAGLWTNTCCSHPRVNETVESAARRRLKEEMGIHTPLTHRFSFIYRAELENGLIEHELDHVLFGNFDGKAQADPQEVADWKWIGIEELDEALKTRQNDYTAWLLDCWPRVKAELRSDSDR